MISSYLPDRIKRKATDSVNLERALDTQRHRLLRIIAGLLLMLGVLALGPVSRRFSDWTLGFVGSVLSRAEAAARNLLMAQAYLMLSRSGFEIDRARMADALAPALGLDEVAVSLSECRQRLWALRAMVSNLPRHALRLLRRIAKRMQCGGERSSLGFETGLVAALTIWRLAPIRIERPPDKSGETKTRS